MNARRAQDLLRHIIQDKDYGVSMMEKISVDESINILTKILPECIKRAEEKNNNNDLAYFQSMQQLYHPIVMEKIKTAEQLWVVYCETTAYPYMIDGDMLVLFSYINHDEIEKKLNSAGFKVSFRSVDPLEFKNEVGHMYRNGYNNIRFIDGKCEPLVVAREDLYSYEEFFKDDYMTNPGLQKAMLDYFQEYRKETGREERIELLKNREDVMAKAIANAEYMVPCIKEEKDEEIEISHPFIDLTERVTEKEKDEQVIAIPAFTDGFEMDKCYQGHHENMLYKFDELIKLIEELGAAGIIINCLGISYFMRLNLMKEMNKNF
jgi:hypothetical protein